MQKKVKIHCQLLQIMIKGITYLLLLLVSYLGFAQDTDTQFRLASSIDYKINKKWKVGFDYRYALEKDISTFQSSIFQFSSEYKINKKMSVEAGYRYSTSFEMDNQRLFASFIYDYKWNQFTVSSRTRYQFSTPYFDSDFWNEYKEPIQYIRQKLSFDYNIPKSKLSLNFSPEIFIKWDNSKLEYNRIRYQFGSDYKLKYGNALGFSVFYEDKSDATKMDRFVFTTKYNLSIDELVKKIKKKKKKD